MSKTWKIYINDKKKTVKNLYFQILFSQGNLSENIFTN